MTEMKFNRRSHHRRARGPALGAFLGASLVIGISACGGGGDSRVRNAELESCSSPFFEQSRSAKLTELGLEQTRLAADLSVAKDAVKDAFDQLEAARKNVPSALVEAVNYFHLIDDAIQKLEKKKPFDDYNQAIYDGNVWIRGFAQEFMNEQLQKRTAQLNGLVEAHRAAADKVTALQEKIFASVTSSNQVIAMTSCPVILRPADAEDFTEQVATPPSVTAVERKVFTFFEDPIPVETQSAGDPSAEVPDSSSTTSASSDDIVESTTSSVSDAAPVTSEVSAMPSESTTSTDNTISPETSTPTEVTTASVLPIPQVTAAVPSVIPIPVYNKVTPDEIENYILESLPEGVPTVPETSPTIPLTQPTKEIESIINQLDNVINDVVQEIKQYDPTATTTAVTNSSAETSGPPEVAFVVTKAPANQAPSDARAGDVPVMIEGAGLKPSTVALVLDDTGTQIAIVPVSSVGVVRSVVALPKGTANRPIIVAGVSASSKPVATSAPVLGAASTTGTDGDEMSEDSTVDTTGGAGGAGDTESGTESDSGGIPSWLLMSAVVLLLAIVTLLMRVRISRAKSDVSSVDDSSRQV